MIRRLVAGFAVLLLVLAGGLYLYLRSSLPQTEGRIEVRGPRATIRIERDADGIPLITAQDDDDVAFGLGFAHAQDRLFQMELQRRYAAGRLAEIFGPDAVAVDKQMRVLGLYRAAEAEIPYLSPEVNRAFQAYAAGVNAFLASRHGALPPEFLLLRFSPEPWREADSLVWGKLIALQLDGNYRGELLRARMARTIPPADMAFLYPEYPKDAPTTLAMMLPIYRRLALGRLYDALPSAVGPHYASNNWVVDGKHSVSGKPLLANDPHLGFGAPGFWYLARLKTPGREITGGTVAGVPVVVIGHNDHIAWGFTTTTSDVEDLFVEKVDPSDPGRYLTPGGSAPFETRAEKIIVRGAPPVDFSVRATRHGPVLSDALPAGAADRGYVLALSATFLTPKDRSAEALWYADRATDWPSFRAAWRSFVGPMTNIVYADDSGTIGFIAPGLVPIRGKGEGWMPAPGWTGEYDWQGFIPFDKLPSAVNPPSGHFVSANNKIVPDSYPYFLSRDWDLPNRAERIEALLAATPIQSPASSAAIAGRHVFLDGQTTRAADDTDHPRGRTLTRRHRSPEAVGLSHGPRQGRAAAVYRLAARIQPCDPVRPLRRRGGGLLGPQAAGNGSGVDRAPGLVRRPETARRGRLRGPARAGAQNGALRAAQRVRGRYGDMAMGQGACRGFRQPGLEPNTGIARLVRRLDLDPRRVRHAQSRAEHHPRRPAPVRTGLRRRAANHHRSGVSRGCAHDHHPRPVRQCAFAGLRQFAATLA